MSQGTEDIGFLALVSTSRVEKREALWSLGFVGVGAAAVLGMHLLSSRSLAEKNVVKGPTKVGHMRRVIEFDPTTGRAKENIELKARSVRTKKIRVGKKRSSVEDEGVIVSDEDLQVCNICNNKISDYRQHLKDVHGVEVTDPDKKPRRKPRKKRLQEIQGVLTADEWDQIENPKFVRTGFVPKMEPQTAGGGGEEKSARKTLEKELSKVIGKEEAANWIKEGYMEGAPVQVGVQKRRVRYSDEDLDAPILPLSDAGLTVLLVQSGSIPKPANYDNIALEYAIETGQDDPNDLEVDVTLSSGDEGVTTLRKLGITHYEYGNPVFEQEIKKPVLIDEDSWRNLSNDEKRARAVVEGGSKVISLKPRGGDEERRRLMLEALQLKVELAEMEAAKARREEIERCWPIKWMPPGDGCPDWIWEMYQKKRERDDLEVERMRRRRLGQGAPQYYMWEKHGESLNSIPIDKLEMRDDEGKFIYGYILYDEFNKKVPITFDDYSSEGRAKLNEILLGFRKHALVPEELKAKAKIGLLTEAEKKEIKSRQKELAQSALLALSKDDKNFRKKSPELEAMFARRQGRLKVKPGEAIGFGVRTPKRRGFVFKPGK